MAAQGRRECTRGCARREPLASPRGRAFRSTIRAEHEDAGGAGPRHASLQLVRRVNRPPSHSDGAFEKPDPPEIRPSQGPHKPIWKKSPDCNKTEEVCSCFKNKIAGQRLELFGAYSKETQNRPLRLLGCYNLVIFSRKPCSKKRSRANRANEDVESAGRGAGGAANVKSNRNLRPKSP